MFQIYYIKELENVVWPCIQEENEIGLLNAEQYYCHSPIFSLTNICSFHFSNKNDIFSPVSQDLQFLSQGCLVNACSSMWSGCDLWLYQSFELKWQKRGNTHFLLERGGIRVQESHQNTTVLKFLCINTVKLLLWGWGGSLNWPWFYSLCSLLNPFFSWNMLWKVYLLIGRWCFASFSQT